MCLGNGCLLLSLGVWGQSVGPSSQALFVLKTRVILVLLSSKILPVVAKVDHPLEDLIQFFGCAFQGTGFGRSF